MVDGLLWWRRLLIGSVSALFGVVCMCIGCDAMAIVSKEYCRSIRRLDGEQ